MLQLEAAAKMVEREQRLALRPMIRPSAARPPTPAKFGILVVDILLAHGLIRAGRVGCSSRLHKDDASHHTTSAFFAPSSLPSKISGSRPLFASAMIAL